MTLTIRIALATFVVGFVVEGGTELFQFATFGARGTGGDVAYYLGLAATGAGFYLMYRGRYEWTAAHRANVRRGHRLLVAAVAIFVGAVAAIAILSGVRGTVGGSVVVAIEGWAVGGLVALALGNFFLSLAMLVDRLAGGFGRSLAWAAFAWSLGVAVLTGYVVGGEFTTLLDEFFSNPLRLIVSFGPVTFVIAPLFVSYFLFAGSYLATLRHLRLRSRQPPPRVTVPAPHGDP